MIARITGILDDVGEGYVLLRTSGDLTYHVMVSSYTAARLAVSIGHRLTLHTVHYIQAEGQGTTLHPRLAGFLTLHDKAFFELFTTVKGIGPRKALRAMAIACSQIAVAIADRDAAFLQSLPEIGRRMADTIIAELSGKVDGFLSLPAPVVPGEVAGEGGAAEAVSLGTGATVSGAGVGKTAKVKKAAAATGGVDAGGLPGDDSSKATGAVIADAGRSLTRQALEVLVQLGENRLQALTWIDQALAQSSASNRPTDVQALVQRVYQLKAGS